MNNKLKATLALTAAILGGAAQASPEPAPTPVPAPVAAQTPDAQAILQNMANQLAKASAFSVTIRSDYDAIQADGQRIAFGELRQLQLQRPALLRIDSQRSDGDKSLVLFDGKAITAFKPEDKVYARVEKPGTVDQAIVYLVQDLQMTVPLARMLLTTLPQELAAKAETVAYVEQDKLTSPPTDHLAIRSADVDLQLWVTQGAQALPRRVVITYRNEPGQPQFRAELTDWNLAPALKPELFAWTPPAGVEQIPFLAPVRPAADEPVATAPITTAPVTTEPVATQQGAGQ